MSEFIAIHITGSDLDEARRIAHVLVGEKLAACANIVPGLTSIYRWQGKIEEAQEYLLIAKARTDAFDAIQARVVSLHSYDCPCIVAFPLSAGHGPTLDWLRAETHS